MKSISLKEKAIKLRNRGDSYNMIAKDLGLSKSTISDWLREIPYQANGKVIERIGLARAKSAQNRHMVRINSIKEAKEIACQEMDRFEKRDLWFLGIGLYLGEGSKLHENVRLINSDPEIICLAVKWFKLACGLGSENLTIAVHIYPDVDEKTAKIYWSKITGIPLSQFRKTQVDERTNKTNKKKHKLLYGTAHLQIASRGERRFGVFLHRKIIGWIEEAIRRSKDMRV
jgi:predicted transcriptional regulator